jgi:hypothetical protein
MPRDSMTTTIAPLLPARHEPCDRCPATAWLCALLPSGVLLFCHHHAMVHRDGLFAAGAVLSITA